jgi:hypothetical protein
MHRLWVLAILHDETVNDLLVLDSAYVFASSKHTFS